jgi:hypothetical protein
MINNMSDKKIFTAWAVCIFIYLVYVGTTKSALSISVIITLTSICIFPLILRKNTLLRVKDPMDYVKFSEGSVIIGEIKISTPKIKKVALDIVEGDVYFSLPYNQISAGVTPSFIFPSSEVATFKRYLTDNLNEIEFVK